MTQDSQDLADLENSQDPALLEDYEMVKRERDQALGRAAKAEERIGKCDRELGSIIQRLQTVTNALEETERNTEVWEGRV